MLPSRVMVLVDSDLVQNYTMKGLSIGVHACGTRFTCAACTDLIHIDALRRSFGGGLQ